MNACAKGESGVMVKWVDMRKDCKIKVVEIGKVERKWQINVISL